LVAGSLNVASVTFVSGSATTTISFSARDSAYRRATPEMTNVAVFV
jgi:hypothetical protein